MEYSMQAIGIYKQSEKASALKRRDHKDATDLIVSGGGSTNLENDEKIVRRLTPLECERLQGYPDGWTDIGEWTDSKGKIHKAADAPRYKALGNSIALPYWFVLLRRISAQYDRPATLGSLFDGIGGFPLCWEQCNGRGTALWASEIEEFPIAVTKLRFPEEESLEIERGGSHKIVFENHSQDARYRNLGNICSTLASSLGTGGNNQPLVVNEETYRKTGHPRNSTEGQGWEHTNVADTLNVYDNSEVRTPTLIVSNEDNG